MALLRAATLYPINSATVDTGTGIDVRALDDVEAGATDNTTSVRNGNQGTNSERTQNPANAAVTAVNDASTTLAKLGWAVPSAEMDTGNAACVATLLACTLTVSLVGGASGTGTGAVGANDVMIHKASLWKYNTSTDTGTLIVGATGTTSTISAALAYSNTAWSGSVTLTVPATSFAANEVLYIQIGGNLACGAGLAGGARTTTWVLTVDHANTNLVFSGSAGANDGLRARCTDSQSGSGVGTSVRSLVRALVIESTTGVGTSTLTSKDIGVLRSVDGIGTSTSTRLISAERSIIGVGTSTRSLAAFATRLVDGIGTAIYTKRILITRTSDGVGTSTFARQLNAFRTAVADGIGTASYVRSVIFVRVFSLFGIGTSSARVELPIEDLPDPGGGGGGTTIYRKILLDE